MTVEVTVEIPDVVDIYHCQPIHRGESIVPVAIRIAEQIPDVDGPDAFDKARAMYAEQGRLLADALLVELLERRASLLRVPFSVPRGGGS